MAKAITDEMPMGMTADISPSHIGEDLQRARESQGLSLSDVSKHLHISANYLGAIERLDKEALPSLGYVLGFMRSYAKFLGLDTVDAVARYKVESEIPQDLGRRSAPHFVYQRKMRLPKGSVAAGIVTSCFLFLAVWYASSPNAQSAQLATAPTPPTKTLGFTAPQPTQGDPSIVTLRATGPSWVEIKDAQGRIVVSRIFIAGELFETRIDAGMSVSARDAGALELYRGGELYGAIGVKGESLKGLSLE